MNQPSGLDRSGGTYGLLRERVSVVTGGTRGLGAAIAAMCVSEGSRVVVLARTLPKHRLRGVEYRTCDVTTWTDVEPAIQSIENDVGPIGVLVNNVGAWSGEKLALADIGLIERITATSLMSTMLVTRAVLPFLLRRGSGAIVNIGSTSGLPGSRDAALPAATKAAITAFSAALRRELADTDIRVSVVHPDSIQKDESASVGRPGSWTHLTPEQVAAAVRFVLLQPPNVLVRDVTIAPVHSAY